MNRIKTIKLIVKRFLKWSKIWSGDYASWKEASKQTSGYGQSDILEKVKNATLQVKKGAAVYERDSVLFDQIQYSWPVLSSLMWVAAKNNGNLRVVDFGGSLGSSYFQNKRFLDKLSSVEWNIVEQEKFVACGKEYIQDNIIQFFESINKCIESKGTPDVLLLSSVIQYLEAPYIFLEQLTQYNIPHIVVDNMPFNFEDRDRITIQKVPPSIYKASYPCWFLSYNKVKSTISAKYDIFSEHTDEQIVELSGRQICYQGFLAVLKKNNT